MTYQSNDPKRLRALLDQVKDYKLTNPQQIEQDCRRLLNGEMPRSPFEWTGIMLCELESAPCVLTLKGIAEEFLKTEGFSLYRHQCEVLIAYATFRLRSHSDTVHVCFDCTLFKAAFSQERGLIPKNMIHEYEYDAHVAASADDDADDEPEFYAESGTAAEAEAAVVAAVEQYLRERGVDTSGVKITKLEYPEEMVKLSEIGGVPVLRVVPPSGE